MAFSFDGRYHKPHGLQGTGEQIKWCDRKKGRKKCDLCFQYEPEEVWKKNWHWYYLVWWVDWSYWYQEHACHKYKIYDWQHTLRDIKPKRYRSTGLKERELKKLFKRGCTKSKNCLCMGLVQRGFWYCPDCWKIVMGLAEIRNKPEHDIMITDRTELKTEALILRLSGVM
jgi:hypothetical protein